MPSVSIGSTGYNVTVGYSPSLKAVQQAQGIEGPPGPPGPIGSLWKQSDLGISTTSNVAIGTTVVGSGSTVLWVEGDARITGILSVGQNTVKIDGNTNTIQVSNIIVQESIVTSDSVGYATETYVNNLVAISTFSGDYNDLTNTPTNLSSFSNDVGFATVTYVNNAIANLVDSAPSTLDTLNELAAALGDDPNFATTVTNTLASKANLSGANFTGVVTATSFVGDLTGNADTATALETSRNFEVTGDAAAGPVSFDGTANVGLALTLADTTVSAGSYGSSSQIPTFTVDSKGRLTAAGTTSVGTDLTVAGDSGSETIQLLTETLTIAGGTNLTSSAASDTVTIDLDPHIALTSVSASGIITATGGFVGDLTGNADTATALETSREFEVSGDATAGPVSFDGTANVGLALTLADTAVSAGSYGSASEIPTFTVDSKGRLTAAGTVAVSTGMTVSGDSGTETINLLTESLTIAGGTNLTSSAASDTVTINLDNDISLATISASGVVTATGGFVGNLTGDVTGNLTGEVNAVAFDTNDQGVVVTGVATATGGFVGDLTGNADTTTALETARDFSISGDVATASAVSFDATGNVDLAVTLSNTFDANTSGIITATGGFVGDLVGTAATSNFATTSYYLNGQLGSYYLDYNNFTNTPSNLSSFSNDVGYATETYVNNLVAISTFSGDYNDLTNTPTALSSFSNDVGFVTSSIIVGLASEGYVDNLVAISTFSGDYNDLTNKPTIPSDTGDLTNSVGFVTSSVVVGYATEGYVTQQISNLVDGAPEALDTLNELAAALNDDENFATTVTNSLALKAPIDNANLTGVTTTGLLNVGVGGTIITTTGIGSVGIGSTQPGSTLVVNAPSGYSGSVLDTKIGNASLFSVQEQTFSYQTTNTGSKTKFHFGSYSPNTGWVGINYGTHTGPVAYLTSLATTTGVVGVNNTGYLAWLSTTNFTTNYNNWDLRLYRDDAGILAQRNGVGAAQTFRVYNTYTSATDFERANVGWTTNTFIVGTEKGSAGGTARQLELQTDGTTRVAITTDGYVGIGSTQPTGILELNLPNGYGNKEPLEVKYNGTSRMWLQGGSGGTDWSRPILSFTGTSAAVWNQSQSYFNVYNDNLYIGGNFGTSVQVGTSGIKWGLSAVLNDVYIEKADINSPGETNYRQYKLILKGGRPHPNNTSAPTGGGIALVGGAGALNSSAADGGSIYLDGGEGVGTGSNGNILIGTATTSNVGIGSTQPTATLDVVGDVSITGVTTTATLNVGVGGTIITTTDGYVGIGTTNPTSKLTVGGNVSITGVTTTATLDVNGTLNVSGVSTFSDMDVRSFNAKFGTSIGSQITLNGNDGSITKSNGSLKLYGGGISGSEVGILNNSNIYLKPYTGGVDLYYGKTDKKLETLGAGVTVTGTTFTNQLNVSGLTTTATLNVGVGGTIITTTDGYVGIGTTNPTTKLQVGSVYNPQVIGFGTVQGSYYPSTNVLIGDSQTGSSLTPQVGGAWKGLNNNFIGAGAGKSTTTGSGNNFFGLRAGYSNISGSYNNFFGNYAGENNTGSYNVFFGPTVGRKNTGNYNVFFGAWGTGSNNTTGSYNVFFGSYGTGSNNTTGSHNVFFGPGAGFDNITGSYNNFLGYQAGRDNISGSDNNVFGRSAGLQLTTGSYNNIFGVEAGYELRGGTHNIFMGRSSGYYEEGDNNIFLGAFSGRGFVSGSPPLTSGNILIGFGTASNARFAHPDVTKSNQFAVGIRTDSNPSKYWLVGNENFNIGIGATNPTEKLTVGGNILINDTTLHGSITATTSTTSTVGIHSALPIATYRSVEYTIQATEGSNFHATKILALHDGSSAYPTQYGTIYNNAIVSTFDVDVSGGNIRLLATPASSSTTNYTINFIATKI